jgi:Tfp pilus assembly protein PilX
MKTVGPRGNDGEDGVALIIAMLCTLLLTALGVGLVLTTSAETAIVGNYRSSQEALYAADAALERAMADVFTVADWNQLLSGAVPSTFIDGSPSGKRTLADGSTIDLGQLTNGVNCEKATTCSATDMNAVTADRPWGSNNPRWQAYAYGRLADMLPAGTINSPFYVVVFVADDPSETDGDPLHDGASPATNPGSGVIALRAEAFGPRGAHRVLDLTVARTDPGLNALNAGNTGARVLSWRNP